MIDRHIIPATVMLSLSAYDVDEDGAVCPEVDHIYVNGYQVTQNGLPAKLSGANETWSVPSFQIPLRLPPTNCSARAVSPVTGRVESRAAGERSKGAASGSSPCRHGKR